MANKIQVMKIMDGDSHVTLHVYIESDGVSGDLVNQVILDPTTDLTPPMPSMQDLIVKQVWSGLANCSVTLAFNATTPWAFWTLAPTAGVHYDWRFFGGIRDNSDAPMGLDSTGELLISTNGFTTTSAKGAFVLWMEKRNRPNPQS